jgi:hypothetical protein
MEEGDGHDMIKNACIILITNKNEEISWGT